MSKNKKMTELDQLVYQIEMRGGVDGHIYLDGTCLLCGHYPDMDDPEPCDAEARFAELRALYEQTHRMFVSLGYALAEQGIVSVTGGDGKSLVSNTRAEKAEARVDEQAAHIRDLEAELVVAWGDCKLEAPCSACARCCEKAEARVEELEGALKLATNYIENDPRRDSATRAVLVKLAALKEKP